MMDTSFQRLLLHQMHKMNQMNKSSDCEQNGNMNVRDSFQQIFLSYIRLERKEGNIYSAYVKSLDSDVKFHIFNSLSLLLFKCGMLHTTISYRISKQ